MPGPIAVLDANVLYPMGSRDFFMWVHLEGVYQPKWTTAIHGEWIRNVAENEGIPRAKLQRCRALMDKHASSALVTRWKRYLPQLEGTKIDPKDRHVVAAALKAQRDAGDHAQVLIITSDVRHFPIADLQALGLSRMQPDASAFDLFRHNPDRVLAALCKMRAALRNPPFTTAKFLSDVIGKGFPRLVEAVAPFRAMIRPIRHEVCRPDRKLAPDWGTVCPSSRLSGTIKANLSLQASMPSFVRTHWGTRPSGGKP